MNSIQIPSTLYERARQAAQRQNVSVDEYISGLLSKSLPSQGLVLTSEQVEFIRKSEASIAAGNCMTIDQLQTNLLVERKL